jgi:hypothetical protein
MAVESRIVKGSGERRFYTAAAIIAALLVLVGFARSYYLKSIFGAPVWAPVMTPLVHLHGALMTSWIVLFVVQTALIATRRTRIHRRLGVFGGLLAATMIIVGPTLAIHQAKIGRPAAFPGGPLRFLVIPLGDMVVFAVLVAIGLYFRNRPQIHRRLMLLATLSFLAAAIARIPIGFIETGGPLVFYGLLDLLILAIVVYDTVKNRRLHPAFSLGALFIIASHPLRIMLAGTNAWLHVATWLAR